MPYTNQVVLLLFVATILSVALAAPSGQSESCRMEYQRKFQELMTYKQSCADTTLKDCCQIANGGQVLGITANTFMIHIINDVCTKDSRNFQGGAPPTIKVRCDTDEGWMVIMKRNGTVSPLVNFSRLWRDYEDGFGDLNTEFWYGLKNIHCLTQRDDVELMIELKQNDGSGRVTWTYQEFRVDGPETNYVLHIGGAERIEGTGSECMAWHNGQPFSTIDRDNDASGSTHCAAREDQGNGGGWWYNACYSSALTRPHTGTYKIYWNDGSSNRYFHQVEMKIRPKNCLMSDQENCK